MNSQIHMPPSDLPELSSWQRFVLNIKGRVYIGMYAKPGWNGTLPFYVAKCPRCGPQIMRPRGKGWLQCPECKHPQLYFVGYKGR